MATDRLSLLLESKTIGLEDVLRMENAINRVIEQSQKARAAGDGIAKATSSVSSQSQKFGADFAQFVRDPLGGASAAAEGFLSKLGPMGLALGGAAAAATAAGTALVSWINSTGDAAEKILNLSITTGLGAKEVQLFQGALELSGASIEDLEKASIKLNQQLADTGPAGQKARKSLADIGVSIYDANGALKEAGPLLLDLSRGLSSVGDRAERDRIGVDLLGKSYRALIPAFTELGANVETLKRDGLGIDEQTLQRADALADKLTRVNSLWSQQLTILKSIAAQFAEPFLDAQLRPGPSTVGTFQFGALPIPGSQQTPGASPEISARLFAPAAGGSTLIDPVRAGRLRGALRGGSSIETQRQQLSDLRNEIDSQRQKIGQLATTPGLTEAAATREVAALKGLEAQYRNLEASIEAAEKAKRDFEKLNALGTFTLTDQFFAPEQFRQQFAGSPLLRGGPLGFLNEGTFGTTGVGIVARRTPSLLRSSAPLLANPFDLPIEQRDGSTIRITDSAIQGSNSGAEAAALARSRAVLEGSRANDERARQRQVEALQQSLAFETERLRLIAGPGGELATIKAIATLRLDAAEKELAITGKVAEFDQARLQIARDRQLETLRFNKERDDRNRQTGGQVFDALLAGGAGLRGFAGGLGLGAGRTAFGNLFAEVARGTTGLLQLPGQTGADGRPNLLGRVLAGTPFGIDPNKLALDANTLATQANTAALLGGRAAGTLSGLPSGLFGGAGSNPLIFSATGGTRSAGIIGADGLPLGIAGQGLNIPSFGLTTAQKIGAAAGIAGGGFLIKSGIQQGGVAGALDIGSGAAGSLAALLPLIGVSGPAAPILAGVALALQVGKGFLPDRRKARARSIQEAIDASRFDFGDTTDLFRDVSGSGALDKGNVTVVQMNIQTLSPRSFLDHATEITDAVREGIRGDHPIVETLQARLDTAGAY